METGAHDYRDVSVLFQTTPAVHRLPSNYKITPIQNKILNSAPKRGGGC